MSVRQSKTKWLFVLGFVPAFGLAWTSVSDALDRRTPGAACVARRDVSSTDQIYYSGGRIINFSTSTRANIVCPVWDDDRFTHTAVATLNLHGFASNATGTNGTTNFQACTTSFVDGLSTCTGTLTASPGNFTVSFSFPWGNHSDFAYIDGELGRASNGQSKLFGYWISN